MFLEFNRFSLAVFSKELKALFLLAWPMYIGQIAQVGIGVVDTIMAGRVGKDDLAGVSLGSSLFLTLFITFMGVMIAFNPIIAQAFGSGKKKQIGEIGRQGIWFGLLVGLLGMFFIWLLLYPIGYYLTSKDYTENVVYITQFYLFAISFGFPFAMIYRGLHAYASSLNETKIIMIVSIVCLFLNIPLNYIFVYGLFGLPALGGIGCGIASAIIFAISTIALFFAIVFMKKFQPYGLLQKFSLPNWAVFKQIIVIGVPIAFSFFLEVSSFTFIAFFIISLGVDYVASQQVILNISGLMYMLPQSLGAAVTVRVGQAVGARNFLKARYISGIALFMGLIGSIFAALFLISFRESIVGIYTNDVQVFVISSTVLIIAAIFQIPDAMQTIASGALRGYKITRVPMLIHAVAFWIIGLGLGYYLAFNLNYSIYGFWIAMVFSLGFAAILLIFYLEYCSKAMLRENNRSRTI